MLWLAEEYGEEELPGGQDEGVGCQDKEGVSCQDQDGVGCISCGRGQCRKKREGTRRGPLTPPYFALNSTFPEVCCALIKTRIKTVRFVEVRCSCLVGGVTGDHM